MTADAGVRPPQLRPGTVYAKRREHLISRGQWQPYTAAQPVRDHVTAVRAATGMSVTQFAARAGLDQTTVNKILTSGQATVTTVVAAKIRAVTPAAARPDAGLVDATGARRRLQGLTWAGYTAGDVAAVAGVTVHTVRGIRNGTRPRIFAGTDRKVTAAYDALLRRPRAPGTPAARKTAAMARALAARHGWLSPWTWDDDNIDDPAATPQGRRQ
jgi:hypothetical protein